MKSPLEVIDSGEFSTCELSLRVSDGDVRVFRCEHSLRLLPGRRLTCLATSDNKKYVIKIFPHRSRSKHEYEREVSGYNLLHNASIDIPGRIYHGPASGKMNIIIYQYLSGSRMLSQVLSGKPSGKAGRAVMSRFLELLIRLHRDRLIHEDPHLDNFLLKGNVIYVLDAGTVRHVSNEALVEGNFAMFVAQFPVSWHIDEDWLDSYVRALHANIIGEFRERLITLVQEKQAWRERHVLGKIYRECSGFHVDSSLHGKLVINKEYMDEELSGLLFSPPSLFDGNDVQMLKEGRSSTVGVVSVGGKKYVVKRYNIKSIAHRLKQMVRESRASRSWRNAHRLQLRGIATARPVAMFEGLKGRLQGVSVFAMEYLEGTNSADYFRQDDISDRERHAVAVKILEMLSELKRERLSHGDLKSTNFIIVEGTPFLVDLDSMRTHRKQSAFDARFAGDIKRFRENWAGDEKTTALFDSLYDKYGLS